MLEAIQEYAGQRLAALAGADELRRRHASHYAALATSVEDELTGSEQEGALELVAIEYDNLRSAMEWCERDPGTAADGLAIAAALVMYWYLRGMYVEGMAWIERMRAVAGSDDGPAGLRALWGFGFFGSVLHDPRSRPALERCLATAGRIGDRSMVARSLNLLGLQAFIRDDLETAFRSVEAGIAEARAASDGWCLVDALGTIGSFYPLLGRNEEARAASGESLALARTRRDLQGMRMALLGLSLAGRRSQAPGLARPLAQEGLDISARLGDAFFMSYFLWILSTVDRLTGDRPAAAGEAAEALRLAQEVGVPFLTACALEAGGAAAHDGGDLSAARSSLEESVAIGRGGGVPGAYAAEALQSLATVEAERGDAAAARALLEEALARARHVSDRWSVARAEHGLQALDAEAAR